jgi:glycosyltransferase involved in cell wall biosynthesis
MRSRPSERHRPTLPATIVGGRTRPYLHDGNPTPVVERSHAIVRTAFASTYPPRRCGIATFTQSLAAATESREIVALHPVEQTASYPLEVHHRIRRDIAADHVRVARSLAACVDVVSIQHEYGIWGGDDGSHVLDFVGALDVPAIATLHTVLRTPTVRQRAILTQLLETVSATVVMSRSAATLLTTAYGIDPRRLDLIPHGVPNLPLVDAASIKPSLELAGREVLLSFGLLGPGKGYELAIEALPAVVARHPNVCYVVVGATHPDLLEHEGEAYRASLVARVKALGLRDHVRFVDRFVGRVELTRWLEAADVFVTPYPNLDQIVSGTLSYAMGAGRAIVSTPYAYAAELLADGRGILVQPGSAARFAAALNEVLGDHELRARLGRAAYAHSRRMVWPEVASEYRRLFDRVSAQPPIATSSSTLAAVHA